MSVVCRGLNPLSVKILTEGRLLSACPQLVSARSKFTKARIPEEVRIKVKTLEVGCYYVANIKQIDPDMHLAKRSQEHEKYGGDPDQPHKLHIVTRVKSVMRRPYWEKEMVKHLGLQKAHAPVIHKNTPAVNSQLKFVKHLVRIQPLRTPYGLPGEQDMAETYINSKGELIVRRLLQPVDPKAIES